MFGNLWFEDYVKIGSNIWFAAGNYNGLYRFDILSKEVKRIAVFPDESIAKRWAFRRVKLWKNQLVFMPAYVGAIYVFDLKEETFKRIDVLGSDELNEEHERCIFQCYEIYGEWLYLIGHEYPGIIKINLTDYQIKKIKNIPQSVLVKNSVPACYFGNEVVVRKNDMYITCPSSNRILILHMDTDSFDIVEVGDSHNKYFGIHEVDSEYYLISCKNDNIIRWNPDNRNCAEIELEFDVHFFDRKICQTQNYIWIFSYLSDEIFRISKGNHNISKIRLDYPSDKIMWVFFEEMQNGIYFLNMYDGEWHFLSEDGIDKNSHFGIEEPNKIDIMKQFLQEGALKKGNTLSEGRSDIATLELLLLKVLRTEDETEGTVIYTTNNGKTIYTAVTEEKN